MFTYDLSTNLGKVRLLITDTDSTSYIFEDAELDAFLGMDGNNVYMAAASAYETVIRSRGLLAAVITREGYSSTQQAISNLRDLVKDLKNKAITADGLQTGTFAVNDEHFESYRPGWRGYSDPPIDQ